MENQQDNTNNEEKLIKQQAIEDKKKLQNWDERDIVKRSTMQNRPEFERSNLNPDREKRSGSNLNPDRNGGDR